MNKILLFVLFVTSFCYSQNDISQKISEKINESGQAKFDSIAKSLNYKGGDQIKVHVLFTINENGDIVNVKARSVHPLFEKEAIRILSELPNMTSVNSNEKLESQIFALPLVFVIETDKERARRIKKEKRKLKNQ